LVRRGQPAALHVFLALQLDRLVRVEAVLDAGEVGLKLVVVRYRAALEPLAGQAPDFGALVPCLDAIGDVEAVRRSAEIDANHLDAELAEAIHDAGADAAFIHEYLRGLVL